jgi:indole-3-acetate monooxygenase
MLARTVEKTRSEADLVSGLIGKAREIAPALEEAAAENEALGRLNDSTIKLLRDAGFFDLYAPAEFGGLDLGPYSALRIVEQIFWADGAAGWIAMAQNVQLKMLAMMPYDSVKKMYAKGTPGLGGQGAPSGTAVAVEGGYKISGSWSYGSNVLHADYVSGTCIILEGGVPAKDKFGMPRTVRWMAPFDEVDIKGNWDVLGLKATGSVDYGVTDLFIPEGFAMTESPFTAKPPEWVKNPSPLSIIIWVFWGHAVGELGMGRRILDEMAALATKPSPRRGRLADDPVFRTEYAKAEAAFEAARAWNYQIWQDLQDSASRGLETTRKQLTLARAAMLHVQGVNAANANFVFREAGGASLRDGNLQRLYRDIMTAGQHLVMSRAGWSECAKDFLGEAEDLVWGPYQLMKKSGAA